MYYLKISGDPSLLSKIVYLCSKMDFCKELLFEIHCLTYHSDINKTLFLCVGPLTYSFLLYKYLTTTGSMGGWDDHSHLLYT